MGEFQARISIKSHHFIGQRRLAIMLFTNNDPFICLRGLATMMNSRLEIEK
jgi:hypothetical protein